MEQFHSHIDLINLSEPRSCENLQRHKLPANELSADAVMTRLGRKSSYRGDNKIENWRNFDNYLKKMQLIEDAPMQIKALYGFRKSKSDFELSRCTCSNNMGSEMSRPRSFHNFEMLEDQNVTKKPPLPDTSDCSEDDYLLLDSTDDDETHNQDEPNDLALKELKRQSTDDVFDNRNIGHNLTDGTEEQSSSCEFVSSPTNFDASGSRNGICASLGVSSFDEPFFHKEPNSNDSENVIGGSDALKNDSILKRMTLPKSRTGTKSSAGRRSLRHATELLNSEKNDVKEYNLQEVHISLKKLNPSESLLMQPPNDASTLVPTEREIETFHECASEPDVFNVLLTELTTDSSRPRQYGRRSNPVRISSFASDNGNGAARIVAHHHQEYRRPISAPTQRAYISENTSQRHLDCCPSEVSSLDSSRNSSPVSVASSSDSSIVEPIVGSSRIGIVASSSRRSDEETEGEENTNESKEFWPHSLSRPISTVFCSLGLFNLSRCAIFTVHFGANFLVQFLILSFIFGIPLLWLQMCLGQKIKGGIVTLFKITPICKGIGVALIVSHCIITLYSSVSIGWLIVYIRDSFRSNGHSYKWEERFESFRSYQNGTTSTKLAENIVDYWNFVVLQRHSNFYEGNQMKFQLALNVSIVWTLVFVLLCQGVKSLGRIVIGMAMLSFSGLFIVCIKFLTLLSFESFQDIFPATDWQDFFANSNSWSVAAQESFLTWGLLGVSVYGMYCKSDSRTEQTFVLRREAFLIVFLTFFGLVMGAVIGSTCVILLGSNGYNYYPASFENPKNDIFLWPSHQVVPTFSTHHSFASKSISRFSNVLGESFDKISKLNGIYVVKESGYKPIRLVTEILPATLAAHSKIDPAFGTIAFVSLFLLGLAQLGVMWKPIAASIGNNTSAILLSCITGLFLSFPFTTDNGIVITHYLDYIFGGAWWLLVLWTSFIVAIFFIRGSPCTSDILAKELKFNETFSVFLAFSWNVLVPLALVLLSVIEYRKSHSRELFHQKSQASDHLSNWPVWAKLLGGVLQLSLLAVIPVVSIVQIYVYLSKGPRDILERIELLFRPPMEPRLHAPLRRLNQQSGRQPDPVVLQVDSTNLVHITDVPPPKYSPPPSYGRATGARIAKVLRNSIRRSVRRFRRSEDVRPDVEGPSNNIPSISSRMPDSAVNSVNDFIRTRIQRQTEPSLENLLMSDLSVNSCGIQNEANHNSTNHQW